MVKAVKGRNPMAVSMLMAMASGSLLEEVDALALDPEAEKKEFLEWFEGEVIKEFKNFKR